MQAIWDLRFDEFKTQITQSVVTVSQLKDLCDFVQLKDKSGNKGAIIERLLSLKSSEKPLNPRAIAMQTAESIEPVSAQVAQSEQASAQRAHAASLTNPSVGSFPPTLGPSQPTHIGATIPPPNPVSGPPQTFGPSQPSHIGATVPPPNPVSGPPQSAAPEGTFQSPARKLKRTSADVLSSFREAPALPSYANVATPSDPKPPPSVSGVTLDQVFEYMQSNMATKTDIQVLQRTIETRTKEYVDGNIERVATEMAKTNEALANVCDGLQSLELRSKEYVDNSIAGCCAQITALRAEIAELKSVGVSSTGTGASAQMQALLERQQIAIDRLDSAHKCISIIGLDSTVDSARRAEILNWFEEHLGNDFEYVSIGSIKTGVEQKLTAVSYIEFYSRDDRERALKFISQNHLSFKVGDTDKDARIGRLKTQKQLSRNRALRKAKEAIEKHSAFPFGARCEIKWLIDGSKERCVCVNESAMFVQGRNDILGAFKAPYQDIVIR